MNIRNRCTKVCLFLWVLGMCFAAHPLHAQSVIPVPLKIEQGTGSFLLSEKTKLYTNIQGGEARLLESYLQALPVHLKKGKKKDTQNILSLSITEKSRSCHHRKAIPFRHPEQILIPPLRERDYSIRNPDPVAVGTTFGGRQLFHSLCRDRR